ncbi:MAG: HlyD family secretion protein [Marinibacterium sp.]
MSVQGSRLEDPIEARERFSQSETALVTQIGGSGSAPPSAYLKNADGTLFRIGPAEYFLLKGLIAGHDTDAVSAACKSEFGLPVSPQAVGQFANQMVENGILTRVVDTDVPDDSGKSPEDLATEIAAAEDTLPEPPQDIPAEEPVSVESVEVDPDGNPDADPHGPADPDDFTDLEDFSASDDLEDIADMDEFDEEEDAIDAALEQIATFSDRRQQSRSGGTADAGAHAKPGSDPRPGAGFRSGPEPKPNQQQKPKPEGIADARVAERDLKFSDTKPADPKVRDMDIVLFDPTRLLRVVERVFGPLGYVLGRLVVPFGLLALLIIFHRLNEVGQTIFSARQVLSLPGALLLSLVTVNLSARLASGVMIQRHGGQVRRFGLVFMLLIIPRFTIDMTSLYKMDRDVRVSVLATALRTRFLIFTICTLLWAMSRQSGTFFPQIMAVLGQIGLLSFILSGFPLLSGEGYQLMSAYFDKPMLRERSLAFLFGREKEGQEPPTAADKWVYTLFGIGALLTSALLATVVLAYLSTALEGRFGGTGVVILLVLIAMTLGWLVLTRRRGRRVRKQMIKEMIAEQRKSKSGSTALVPVGGGGQRSLVPGGAQLPATSKPMNLPGPLTGVYGDNAPEARRGKWIRRGVFAGLAVILAVVAMLPYTYEPGGDFVILSDDRVQVVAWVDGELAAVLVDEGDVVDTGDLLAQQENSREKFALQVSKANLAKARAQLQNLLDGATPEEIEVSEQEVARQEARLEVLKSEAERAEQSRDRGVMPTAEATRIIGNYETGKVELSAAKAQLDRVKAAAQDSEIAILQADIDRLEAEVAFNQENLESTEIRAPVGGQIVFEEANRPVPGKYYKTGGLVMEIVSNANARAEIEVPEADVGLVAIGEPVRLKFWALPEQEQVGTVSSLAPVAEDVEYGKIVRVKTILPNPDGLFRPGMTGFAKIQGEEMRVWQAYSRMFVRFVLIELWGWIP